MKKQPIKVTSQQTVEIAGGRLAATKEDRTNGNFMCGKMLVGGAIVGAAVAAVTIFTGGIGGIILGAIGAIGGTLGGAALGTAVSMTPCFCALATMPNDWIGYHPKVTFEGHNALLENAILPCMLGGKIEIIYFEEFADVKLSNIRKNAAMEAGIQALKVTAFLRFPTTFIAAYALANVGLDLYTGKGAGLMKAAFFVFEYPNEALKINEDKAGTHSISQNASRATVSLYQDAVQVKNQKGNPIIYTDWKGDHSKLLENENNFEIKDKEGKLKINEGTQGNAFRHPLWQAMITSELDENYAKRAGDSHELNSSVPYNPNGYENTAQGLEEADSYIDQLHNEIGRKIGKENPNASPNELANKVLDYYHEHGLWELELRDGKFFPIKKTLPQEQYNELKKAVDIMNRYGYLENAWDEKLKKLGVSEENIVWFKSIPKAKEY